MGSSRLSAHRPKATASTLANEAATRGLRPPLQLLAPTGITRGWLLIHGEPDCVFADEFGDLIWGRMLRSGAVHVIRPCWPEEARTLAPAIGAVVQRILGDYR